MTMMKTVRVSCLLAMSMFLTVGCVVETDTHDEELRGVQVEDGGEEGCPPLAMMMQGEDGGDGDEDCLVCDEESGQWVWDDEACGDDGGEEPCPPLSMLLEGDDGGDDDDCLVCDEQSGQWVWDDEMCGEDDGGEEACDCDDFALLEGGDGGEELCCVEEDGECNFYSADEEICQEPEQRRAQ